MTLQLAAGMELGPWDSLTLHFDMPELAAVPHLSGRVSAIERVRQDRRTDYSRITLSDLQGSVEALGLLRPGFLVESPKPWDQMKRR